jgi:hypothetical protein
MRLVWIFPPVIGGRRHGHGSGHIGAFVTGCKACGVKANNYSQFNHQKKIQNLLVIINNFCSNRFSITAKWQESQEGR